MTNMFDGVPDQFLQFIAPRTSSLPLHLSFPLNASLTPNTDTLPPVDPYHLPLQQPNLLHPLHHHPPSPTHKHEQHKQDNSISRVSMNLEIQRERQLPELIDSCWTHDEVLALFRIRSSLETWFPDLTWEHVSRMLAELGFKRSAEKCKEKFEEESRYLNNINYNENYRFISEFEQELYQGEGDHQNPEVPVGSEKSSQQLEKPREGQDKTSGHALEEGSARHDTTEPTITKQSVVEKSKDRKRKKHDGKFEMFKGFCENIVNKMMAQQEEMHNKLLEDMLKRDEEKFEREEAWKKQELDRMNKELEMMAREQAMTGNRQATVIEFLKRFAASPPRVTNGSDPQAVHSQNLILSFEIDRENNLEPPPSSLNYQETITTSPALPITCPSTVVAAENPSSSHAQDALLEVTQKTSCVDSISTCKASSSTALSSEKGDVGRRWPRDEVIALINLRCSLNNNSEDKEGNKAPLWERISQGMSDLGYKRSAKRCKEKWENINKYFRKTKDINKKRSLDSRTCPYFHHLATLYTQGKLVPDQFELKPESQMVSPPNHPQIPSRPQPHPSHQVMHVDGGDHEETTQCT